MISLRAELTAVTGWLEDPLEVATEEMLHLALVQNLLSAIGAAPHFARPNLRAPAHHYTAACISLWCSSARRRYGTSSFSNARGDGAEGRRGTRCSTRERRCVDGGGRRSFLSLQDFATSGTCTDRSREGIVHLAEKFGERQLFVGPPRAQATAKDFGWPELVVGHRPGLSAEGDRHDPRAGRRLPGRLEKTRTSVSSCRSSTSTEQMKRESQGSSRE